MKMVKIEEMSNETLVSEINAIEQFIEVGSYGKRDLLYQDDLWKEAEKRGLRIQKEYTLNN